MIDDFCFGENYMYMWVLPEWTMRYTWSLWIEIIFLSVRQNNEIRIFVHVLERPSDIRWIHSTEYRVKFEVWMNGYFIDHNVIVLQRSLSYDFFLLLLSLKLQWQNVCKRFKEMKCQVVSCELSRKLLFFISSEQKQRKYSMNCNFFHVKVLSSQVRCTWRFLITALCLIWNQELKPKHALNLDFGLVLSINYNLIWLNRSNIICKCKIKSFWLKCPQQAVNRK